MPTNITLNPIEQMSKLKSSSNDILARAQSYYIQSVFSQEMNQPIPTLEDTNNQMQMTIFGLEAVGFDLDERASSGALPNGPNAPWIQLILPAYKIRRVVPTPGLSLLPNNDPIERAFLEALDGVIAHRQPELRLRFSTLDLNTPTSLDARWDIILERDLKRAFLLIIRKGGGFEDLNNATHIVKELREKQVRFEPLISEELDAQKRIFYACRTLALYNCVRVIEITNNFIRGTEDIHNHRLTARGAKIEIERHIFNAKEILSGLDPLLLNQVIRLGRACANIIDSSVFSVTFPPHLRDFVKSLVNRPKNPILEFWFAQKQAINSSLLDPTKTAIVVSMPTSAGKTLLAEFSIIQSHFNSPDSKVVYLAPTRALVTQISLTLRKDLVSQNLRVFVATPTFELNPVENELLTHDFDILVTTPEKFDLLIRTNHQSVQDISLVIVDEAHNLSDRERGGKIELLLSTLRREREGTRFLLLTPFANNAIDLARWLGDENGVPIVIDWKPNDRVVGVCIAGKKEGTQRQLLYRTLSSVHSDSPPDVQIEIGKISSEARKTKKKIAVETTIKLADIKKGGVLLLAGSRKNAFDRAFAIAAQRQNQPSLSSVELVCRYLDTEAGREHPLSVFLRKGVAFHHAGLSPEARYLIERLVEEKAVSIICATTTLIQGVNFPLSAAVIESFHRPVKKFGSWRKWEEIEPVEFWNLAGRVGRTLEDALGSVCFIARDQEDINDIQNFLSHDASIVASSLVKTIREIRDRDVVFSTELIEKYSPLSAFLQYLVHSIVVGGQNALDPRAIENLLRGSFAYSETLRENQQFADDLIRLARRYINELVRIKGTALMGFASIADSTGFSSPSIDLMWSNWRTSSSEDDWNPDVFFPGQGRASPFLINAIETLGRVPELHLGSYFEGDFSPARIARITNAWVNGKPLIEIANSEYHGDILECTRHVYTVVSNLLPWGLRAIQRVRFAGQANISWENLELLPAMVVHGVKTKEAIALRMLDVPRMVAEKMAENIRQANINIEQFRDWLSETSPSIWQDSLPTNSTLTGLECKLIWQVISGERKWEEIRQELHPNTHQKV